MLILGGEYPVVCYRTLDFLVYVFFNEVVRSLSCCGASSGAPTKVMEKMGRPQALPGPLCFLQNPCAPQGPKMVGQRVWRRPGERQSHQRKLAGGAQESQRGK